MTTLIEFDEEARRALERGMDALAGAVKVTLGPGGRNVALERKWGPPLIVNDGVSVAKEIDLEDPFENLGAQLVKEVAERTEEIAGDGTTTATVLAQAMVKSGLHNVASGANPIGIKRGMEIAAAAVVQEIRSQARELETHEQIAQVSAISANNDPEIGRRIADALDKVGKDGVITVEESNTFGVELEIVEGMRFDKGYVSPYFVTDTERMEAVLSSPYILLADQKIAALNDIVPLLEKVIQAGRPLLILAEDIEGEALATLVVNRIRGSLSVCAVKAPGFGDRRKAMMSDIAVLTGGQLVSQVTGVKLETATLDMLGTADKVVVARDETTIVEGGGSPNEIAGRINEIRAEIERTDSGYDREKLQGRLARLSGGIAVLKVGAATDVELKETKHRIEDAIRTTRAAVEEGIVPGGGVTLLRAQQVVDKLKLVDDEATGARIVRRALEEPLRVIAENAGLEPAVVVADVRKLPPGEGLDARTERYVNLVDEGIIDAAKVTRSAVENAVSIAGLFLTAEVLIAEKPAGSEDSESRSQ